MGNILKHKIDKDFTIISNELMRTRMSAKAKGLFLQIVSLPEGWNFSIAGLSKLLTDKEHSIKSGINELVRAGFLTWERYKGQDGRYTVTVTTMYPSSQQISNNQDDLHEDSPYGGKPHGKIPYGENPGNIIYNNKELNNKELNNIFGTEESVPEKAETSKEIIEKKPTDEVAKAYYDTIKALKLPVRNHNNVRSKIKQLKQELGEEDSLKYLDFIVNIYPTLPDDGYKPRILEALDIYAKRMAIGSWVKGKAEGRGTGLISY